MKRMFICLLVLLIFAVLCSCDTQPTTTSDRSSKVCDHDWGPERTQEDCWSVTITRICSKCHTENWSHGDYGWPQHKWKEETEDGQTTFTCTRCQESYSFATAFAAFSYAKVLEDHRIGDPGVKQGSFYHDLDNGITCAIDAILMAKYYLTVEYDTIAISYDETTGVWCVDFYTRGVPGGNQAVYVNESEQICYIVYGE